VRDDFAGGRRRCTSLLEGAGRGDDAVAAVTLFGEHFAGYTAKNGCFDVHRRRG
jgi:hypothetical protein